ncbi:MAG: IS1634 family transposase [Deltaproteobacteria bacterium]|nr:IS1634 family transposase [Deltaproteobacteria bacterium]
MSQTVVRNVQTKGVGFAPILRHYFEKCEIAKIIDENVPLDPRRKVLTHGQASVAMITGILFQVLQLYRLCKFANETTVLDVIFPDIASNEYFDDRLADTLDALFKYGIGNLETLLTQNMINVFQIETDLCHNDTTSASVYGQCNKNKTAESIKITFGYSKKHRQDLKQLVWSLSVSSDSAFPLFQKAYSGNTADVDTYVEQWRNLIDLLGRRDFLYVADSKIITKENMAHIHENEGFFIAPAPMYETYKIAFYDALDQHDQEILIPYKDQINRGFEVPLTVTHEEKDYPFRMISLYDHGLFARKRRTRETRIAKTRSTFDELSAKLNRYKLKTKEDIDKACAAILKKRHTTEFFEYRITNDPVVTYKNAKRGRIPKGKTPEKVAVVKDHFRVELVFNESAFETELYRCGYYPLITNKPKEDLSIEEAMMAHKNQYKSEHTNRRAKSGYSLEPIYLQTPERIEALLLLFKIALQVIVLIERTARKNIAERDIGLDEFMPNRKDVRNPKTEYLLREFEYIVKGEKVFPNGQTYGFVSELNNLQQDILSILEVPQERYTYEYLFDTS